MGIIKSFIISLVFAALPLLCFGESTININTADREALINVIKGIGEKKADAIIQYRQDHGPFSSVDELVNVKGIGRAIVDKNREWLVISE